MKRYLSIGALIGFATISLNSHADEKVTPNAWQGKSGEEVYNTLCLACHKEGIADAPKLGDKAAWADLIEEGQSVLTAHAWVGVRAMPAKGGQPDLTLEAFADAVAWMASKAGADWKTPDDTVLATIREEAIQRIGVQVTEMQEMQQELHKLTQEHLETRLQNMEQQLQTLTTATEKPADKTDKN